MLYRIKMYSILFCIKQKSIKREKLNNLDDPKKFPKSIKGPSHWSNFFLLTSENIKILLLCGIRAAASKKLPESIIGFLFADYL